MQIATTVQSNKLLSNLAFLACPKNKELSRKTIPNIAAKDRLKQLHDAHIASRGRRKRKNDSRWVEALTDVSSPTPRTKFPHFQNTPRRFPRSPPLAKEFGA
ncbi:hypothetical protein BJP07_08385 [Corynebacterium sp. NML130628]|nr:hypothetical protein BJP07_08385 [Corynebacterium sp. NML130628]